MQNNTVTEKDEELGCILMEEEDDDDNESEGLFCSIRTAMLYKILKLMGRWKILLNQFCCLITWICWIIFNRKEDPFSSKLPMARWFCWL